MTTTAEERRKITRKRLFQDFEFYANKALKIRTKDAKVIPFRLNRAQGRLLAAALQQWQETGRVRIVILKARQLGFSTMVGGFLYWWISQHRATKGIVVTHHGDATRALFDMTHLVAPPTVVFKPRIVAAVLRGPGKAPIDTTTPPAARGLALEGRRP